MNWATLLFAPREHRPGCMWDWFIEDCLMCGKDYITEERRLFCDKCVAAHKGCCYE